MPKDLDALLDLCLWIGFTQKWGWKSPIKILHFLRKGKKEPSWNTSSRIL